MRRFSNLAVMAVFLASGAQALGQSVTFDFESGGDQGWGAGFGDDASQTFPVVNIAGSNRLEVLRDGGFQEASINSGSNPYLAAFNAAVANPSGYRISYDWRVDTSLSPGNYGTFLQLGTYINAGQAPFPYQQDFPGAGKDVELDGTQLASGLVFSGTVSETLTAKYGAINPAFIGAPSQRLGLIINGNGAAATVYFDNISITPIPEPATIGLAGVAGLGVLMRRRRK